MSENKRYPSMYSLLEDHGLKGCAFRLILKVNTHKQNFAFNPLTVGNPSSPWTDANPCLCHTPTNMRQF